MNTAKNYRKIQIGDGQDIPYEIGRKLEIMFGLEKEGISNEKISCKSYIELIKEEKKIRKGKTTNLG
ncbi:hypothetical protein C1634_006275 [Chryseobacterium viscerum]|uniref:Uncharacterized protein n=2 Tax=Chryseobacterium viscerum TaxID=1037377 RepID=A0A316WYX4_9FLAO|nr:hypothetical protein C1634_006275 [Chryseobacterium viscerum]